MELLHRITGENIYVYDLFNSMFANLLIYSFNILCDIYIVIYISS